MSGVDVNGGKKRQLPSWMVGVTTTDQIQKPKNKTENMSLLEIQPVSKILKLKRTPLAKKLVKETGFCENDASKVDSSKLVKCETRKRKNKSRQQDLDDEDAVDGESGLRKKSTEKRFIEGGSKIQQSTTSKKRNQNADEGGRVESKVSSPSEEDEELTMEDLMSIAAEYVKADEGKACQQPATTESEFTQYSPSSEFSKYESGGSTEAIQSSKDFPISTKAWSSCSITKTKLKNQESSPRPTGDPTQDMLDLFLGPLLEKPHTEEKKYEYLPEDVKLDCEFRKQNQIENLGEGVVPLTKKKSSLKDKVAMFFD